MLSITKLGCLNTNTDMFFALFQLGPSGRNWIGRSQRGGEPNLKGRIDDFRIYRGALSAAQVGAVMNRQPF